MFGQLHILFLALLLVPLGTNAEAPTVIEIGPKTVRPSVTRFGINMGSRTYWDSGQYTKNLVLRNPGFEGLIYRTVIRCGDAGPQNACVVDGPADVWADGYWDGAACEYIGDGTVSVTTRVRRYTTNGKDRSTVQLESGTAIRKGDYMIVRKDFPGDPAAGWWVQTSGGATLAAEYADLAPDTVGRQAIAVSALGPMMEARLLSMFDTLADRAFVRLSGSYRLKFKAKGLDGERLVEVSVARFRGRPRSFLRQSMIVDPVWREYEFDFVAGEDATEDPGMVQVSFRVEASRVLLDDVSLEPADNRNPTVFTDATVRALEALRPGILRYWEEHLGESLDNLLEPAMGRQRAAYSAWTGSQDAIHYGLHEFLELCELLGAEAWIVMPVTFNAAEASALIEYLAGPPSTAYGARRAGRGHAAPWSDSIRRIHIEFGNEAWNGVYKGSNIEFPEVYGPRAHYIFSAMKRAPYYDAEKFRLVLGGQAAWVGRNQEIQKRCTANDVFTVGPYMAYEVNSFATNEELFGPLFAEAEWDARAGPTQQNRAMVDGFGRNIGLAVYEVNLHTTGGRISQAALDSFTPSLGAGLGVISHMLQMLRDLDVRPQMLYALPQYVFRRPDGKTTRLWGSVVDLGLSDRKRPQFLALQLANEAMSGDMISASHRGADPVWTQPSLNGMQATTAHYLQSFAFRDGSRYALVVMNLHLSSALAVSFSGPAAPSGEVLLKRLTAGAVQANNEVAETVRIATQTMAAFAAESQLVLPPYSLTVLFWQAGGD